MVGCSRALGRAAHLRSARSPSHDRSLHCCLSLTWHDIFMTRVPRSSMDSLHAGTSCHQNGKKLVPKGWQDESDHRQQVQKPKFRKDCVREVFFRDADLASDLADSEPTSGGMLCI